MILMAQREVVVNEVSRCLYTYVVIDPIEKQWPALLMKLRYITNNNNSRVVVGRSFVFAK